MREVRGVERILLVTAEPWARNALSLLRKCVREVEITHALDGAQGLYYLTRSMIDDRPYHLSILTTPIPKINADRK